MNDITPKEANEILSHYTDLGYGIVIEGEDTTKIKKALALAVMVLSSSSNDGWIPVSERLPDKNGKCLVSLDFGDVSLDSYEKDWGFVCYAGDVIAWMPLPAPYKTDHQEESDG